MWASTKYEAHLYECKASREDLKKELRDPTKVEGVGKYATYWWLAVENEKILDGLVIPEAWGILAPEVRGGRRLLKVVRKAPKLKPAVFSPMFAVSMIRNMAKRWVAPGVHNAVKEQLADVLANRDMRPAPDVRDLELQINKLERDLANESTCAACRAGRWERSATPSRSCKSTARWPPATSRASCERCRIPPRRSRIVRGKPRRLPWHCAR